MNRMMTCLAFVAAMMLFGPVDGAQAEKRLAFGATNSQSAHYAYFASLAKVVNNANPNYRASVVETGATVDNLKRMARNQLDIGLVTTSALYHSYHGIKAFETRRIKSKLLWAYSLAPQNVVVRRDSGISSIAAIDGKRMGPGQRGSSTEATSLEVFELLGTKPEWVRGSNSELADLIKDNRCNGFIKSAVGTKFDALTTDIATFTDVQVLGIDEKQEALIREKLPELAVVDMPGGKMENSGPYKTWGFMIAVSASPELDEETAYNIVKAVMEDKKEQAAAFPNVAGVDLAELTLKYAGSPLHPGAIRYFEEVGLTVPDRLR